MGLDLTNFMCIAKIVPLLSEPKILLILESCKLIGIELWEDEYFALNFFPLYFRCQKCDCLFLFIKQLLLFLLTLHVCNGAEYSGEPRLSIRDPSVINLFVYLFIYICV